MTSSQSHSAEGPLAINLRNALTISASRSVHPNDQHALEAVRPIGVVARRIMGAGDEPIRRRTDADMYGRLPEIALGETHHSSSKCIEL